MATPERSRRRNEAQRVVLGNIIRIVVGLGGLIAAGWLAVRTARARKDQRAGAPIGDRSTSFVPVYIVLSVAAVAMVATVPLS